LGKWTTPTDEQVQKGYCNMKKRLFTDEEYKNLMCKVTVRPLSSFKGSEIDKILAQQVELNTRRKRLHNAFYSEKNKRGM
jgi:hypothetical protein